MGKQKDNRVVYREFGDEPEDSVDAVPDIPPNQQQIRIQVSRKGKGGKTVTLVTGLQHPPEQMTAIAKKLKNQCGTGGTVKDGNIEIQGDHAPKLLEIMLSLGYKAKISGG